MRSTNNKECWQLYCFFCRASASGGNTTYTPRRIFLRRIWRKKLYVLIHRPREMQYLSKGRIKVDFFHDLVCILWRRFEIFRRIYNHFFQSCFAFSFCGKKNSTNFLIVFTRATLWNLISIIYMPQKFI